MKTIFVLLIALAVQAQAAEPNLRKIDSLQNVLKNDIPDSVRADAYFQIADEYWNVIEDKARQEANFTRAMQYANQCITLSEKCNYRQGVGDAYYIISGVLDDRGKHIEALEWGKKALQYRIESGDEKKVIKVLFHLGIICGNLRDTEQQLQYYFDGLTREERLGGVEAAGIYHNVGMIYDAAGKRKEAITYTKKALIINEKPGGNKNWLGINCLMLGHYLSNNVEIYNDEALKYFDRGREIFLSLGYKEQFGMALVGLGIMLSHSGKHREGVDTMHKALAVFREIQNKNGIAWTYNCLGLCYTRQKKYREAAVSLDSCLQLCKELGPIAMRNVYQRLYQLDSTSGNTASAYTHYRLYINLRDSISNTESLQALAKHQLRSEYSKKEEREKAEQEKKEALQAIIRNSILMGLVGSFVFLFVVYRQRNKVRKANVIITQEKERSDNLLLNILPVEVAEELKSKGTADARHYDNVTVLFTDFKSFTTISEQLSAQELVNELHACFKGFDEICTKYNIEKIKTIGDAYLAVCGLPLADEKHAENVVNAALEISEFMKNRRKELGAKTFEIRIGINSGSVVAGIVGVKKFAYDIWGDTVNTAARMEQNSEAGKINISETTYALVKDRFSCEYRGEIDAKNKGKLKMYFVETHN